MELIEEVMPLFFFVQVKSTRKQMTRTSGSPRLRVEISDYDVRQMVACPIPTYVIGIHDIEERGFVVAIHGTMSGSISSITTAHELTPAVLHRLWLEVRDFWAGRDLAQQTSSFSNGGGP